MIRALDLPSSKGFPPGEKHVLWCVISCQDVQEGVGVIDSNRQALRISNLYLDHQVHQVQQVHQHHRKAARGQPPAMQVDQQSGQGSRKEIQPHPSTSPHPPGVKGHHRSITFQNQQDTQVIIHKVSVPTKHVQGCFATGHRRRHIMGY